MLLVAGLVLGAGSHLRYVDDLVGSPVLSAGAVLAWFVTVPFVLGGFLGTARDAVGGTGASAAGFVAATRAHYLRLVLATVLFVGIVFGTAVLLGLVGLVVGVGVAALGAIHELLGVAAGVGSVLAWVASLLVVVLFVQFYDAAIVVEDHGVTGAFRRSVRLVGSTFASVGRVLAAVARRLERRSRPRVRAPTRVDTPGIRQRPPDRRSDGGCDCPVGGGIRVLLHGVHRVLPATDRCNTPYGRGGRMTAQ